MKETDRVDRAAEFYSIETEFDKKLIDYRFRTLKPLLHGTTCLELGPGSGHMSISLSEVFDSLTIVEGSQKLLDEIPERPNVRKECGLFEDYSPDEKFDSVVIEHVLEHVENPIALLEAVKNWVAPGGRLFVGVPNADSIHRIVAEKMGLLKERFQLNQRDLDFGHRRVYSRSTLEKDIRAAGLEIIEFEGVFFKPLSNGQIDRDWTEEMWDGFYELGKEFPEFCAEILCVCQLRAK